MVTQQNKGYNAPIFCRKNRFLARKQCYCYSNTPTSDTKELVVSRTNKPMIGILTSTGDVTRKIAITFLHVRASHHSEVLSPRLTWTTTANIPKSSLVTVVHVKM